MKTAQINTEYNELLTMNPAHKSGTAWVRIASSVRSRTLAQSFFNALPAETARWKRCVPRFAPINVLIATSLHESPTNALGITVPPFVEMAIETKPFNGPL
jgi:hypothetical protein